MHNQRELYCQSSPPLQDDTRFFCVADTDGYLESAVYCNQLFACGSAYKVAESGSHGRKGPWDNSSKDADITQLLQESLTEGMWREPLADVDESMAASTIQEVEDEAATDTTSAVSRASAASLLHRNPLVCTTPLGTCLIRTNGALVLSDR